jgi:ketosteroid isomerase-like protein
MSQQNVEVVRRSNAAFNRGDRDEAFADYHPDVELRDLQHAPDAAELVRGIAAVYVIWDQWNAAFHEFTAEIEECVDAGEFVVAVVRWRATGGASGLAVDQRTADLYEFEDGSIVRVTLGYLDKRAALEAVGLAE